MSNSKLICYTQISPNKTSPRNHAIDTITIHCMAGNCSIETCGNIFAPTSRQASSNYGIGSDGRIGMYVEEKDRSWCSSSSSNDNRAVTIEVANDGGTETGWHVSDKAYKALIDLVTDICQRNGIKSLKWKADKSLIGQIDKQNMTVHRWFANKSCPGDYLYGLHSKIAAEVNKRLGAGGATTPSTPESSTAGGTLAVGDVVTFTGSKHYTSANAATGKNCKAGKATITQIYKSGKHPYHLKAVSGGGSNVYGWVDAADISGAQAAEIKVGSTVRLKSGAKTYTGGSLAAFVYTRDHTVKQISGDRVVIAYGGVTVAAVKKGDLSLVK